MCGYVVPTIIVVVCDFPLIFDCDLQVNFMDSIRALTLTELCNFDSSSYLVNQKLCRNINRLV